MNEGQQKFHDFVMARVKSGKEEDLKTLLSESFARQQEGTFTKEYMSEVVPRMVILLRPETIGEFKEAAAHMSSQLK